MMPSTAAPAARSGWLRAVACAALVTAGAGAAGADALAVDSLRTTVNYLADDAREGRGPGTRGIDQAAEFIAARFKAAGLDPAGDHDTYFQGFEVTIGVRPEGRNALRLGGRDLQLDQDWVAYGFSETATVDAPVVFAGYGIRAKEYRYDDYESLDAKGKIVLVLRYEPGQNDSASVFAGVQATPYADLRRKAIEAREAGAVGLLVVTGPASDDPDRLSRLHADAGYYSTGIPCGQISRAALGAALPQFDLAAVQKKIDSSQAPASQALDGVSAAWTVQLAKDRTQLRNVLGLLPGKDPHHVVVIGAHYDHLGMGGESSLSPDAHTAHNGADDNASGTAAVIALARRFAAGPPPAQSILFVAFSGEELGLVGSEYYVKHPSAPLDFTTAMLNMDMVGRLRDRKLLVFGSDTAKEFPALVESLNTAGPRFNLTLKGDGYGPSDHMAFFQKNIPVLHFFTGAHSDYHKPSDDAPLLNYDGLRDVTGFVGDIAAALTARPLTFVAAKGPAPSTNDGGGGAGFRSYLGTVPDYGQDESLKGVLLSGVRAGSPAEAAGLLGGDLIVRIDAMDIRNIYDFVHVLRTRKPGDQLAITVQRGDARKDFQATLAPRP